MEQKVYRTELTPLSFLERSALVFPNKVAVIHETRSYTYQEFAERVFRLASRLRALGMQKHDRVAFLCPNTPALLEAHYAVPAAGGILVAINNRLSKQEIEFILQHSGSKYLFVDHEFTHLIETLPQELLAQVIRIDDTGTPEDPYEQFLAEGSPEPLASWLEDEEETISINYTSGTTGNPKGVMYTYRGAYLNALSEVIETGMNSNSIYLWTLPMFHCNGWCFTWGVTAVGATHVCLRKVDPARIWELFEQEKITHYNGAPTVHIFLVNHPKAHRLEQQITVTIAGAPPSPTLLGQLKELNIRPIHVYGLTETYGPYTVCEWQQEWDSLPINEQARLLARQGQGYVTAERARVVSPEMQDVPLDGQTMGEVMMRGNNVAKGYFENPDATARSFEGGWFHSGDIGVWHTDNYVELRDRAKDVIISGGENISTIEVEQTLVQHPAVLECAVVAIPDEVWGERPKAFVTLKPEQVTTEEELINFCKARLAHFKCPTSIEFGLLPKTSTGKVQKYVLRDKAWAGKEKRIN
ncbi:acyl-CoA synthetase [Dictyobacter vulcani]|uniref:Acyl-CoA synthetase n=1 Tax=Dictyobacter vulcani TaxID=2607529 RepID=A0A5J4KY12_9CHLR|nr:acyl--CoA ligase family protein [Dictyobacter vulcani]GER91039.1 acyl-CoA synthetase [Dictyobacter vulcani]